MTSTDEREITSSEADDYFTRRRVLLQLAAAGVLGTMLPALAEAQQGLGEWEDGDPLCRQGYAELAKPDGYELDAAFLNSFVGLSAALTGVARLDRNLANDYMERFARHPQLSATLKKMIDAYRQIAPGDASPGRDAVKQTFMPDSPADDAAKQLNAGAKQLIYLWYVSAFFLPRADDPTKKAWVYGSAEQYRRGLLWSVIQAHAPMTPGGPPNHWATVPPIA
jgi:hypothetical protein